MIIEHLAIWTDDLEWLRRFYSQYFDAESNDKYYNLKTGFESYFLSFDSGCRLEIMKKPTVKTSPDEMKEIFGLAHFTFKVGNEESVILDPDGNRVEIIA